MEDSRGTSTAAGPSTADIESVQLTEPRSQPPPHQPSPDHGSWLCCVPCYWLRTNNSVHKASLTVATLVVTSILVASPVLFLISSVPAREVDKVRDCHHQVKSHRLLYDCLTCCP